MHENPYETNQVAREPEVVVTSLPRASVGLRLLAYLVDILPITLVIGLIYFLLLGFGERLQQYASDPSNPELRLTFLRQRNQVRDLSFLVYMIYCSALESSSLQGSLGKRLLGLRVTDRFGNRLTFARALGRNFAKIISALPCGLGFLWSIWSPEGRAWHDSIADTQVTKVKR